MQPHWVERLGGGHRSALRDLVTDVAAVIDEDRATVREACYDATPDCCGVYNPSVLAVDIKGAP